MSERLYIGIDLGTYQSTVMSSEGVQTTIETVVGRPKDPVARNFLGRDVVFTLTEVDGISMEFWCKLPKFW